MRRRMFRTHLRFDAMAPIAPAPRDATPRPFTARPDPRPGPDARTDRHRTRALLHEAQRGGDPDELVA